MKILIVAPAFAPFSGVGALRMTSLARYLHSAGDEVTVMRTVPEYYGKESLHTPQPEGIRYVDVDLHGTLKECERDIKSNRAYYQQALEKLLDKEQFDAAVYTGGPYYGMMNAAHMKRKYGLHYILDFRDLWVYDARYTKVFRSRVHLLRYRPSENTMIKHSDYTVAVTGDDVEILKKHYPKFASKIRLILNGYEESEVPSGKFPAEPDNMLLAVFGKLSYYDSAMAKELFEGLAELVKQGYDVKFLNLGEQDPGTKGIIEASGFDMDRYTCTGYVSYKEGLERISRARIGVIVRGNHTGLGTKVFDYIAVNKPIIAMIPQENESTRFVRSFEHGYVCRTADEVVRAFKEIVENKVFSLCDNRETIMSYSRTQRNKEFRDLLSGIAALKR